MQINRDFICNPYLLLILGTPLNLMGDREACNRLILLVFFFFAPTQNMQSYSLVKKWIRASLPKPSRRVWQAYTTLLMVGSEKYILPFGKRNYETPMTFALSKFTDLRGPWKGFISQILAHLYPSKGSSILVISQQFNLPDVINTVLHIHNVLEDVQMISGGADYHASVTNPSREL